MEIIIAILGVVCVTIGYIAGHHEKESTRREEIRKARVEAFTRGQDAAYSNAPAVKRAYDYHFSNRR